MQLYPTDILVATAPRVTTENVDIYVDAVAGSDVTGNGTAGNPYASIDRAYQDVPYRIEHAVHIHIAAGAYTSFPSLNNTYGALGLLSFDGSAAMVDVAGPYTIDAGGFTPLVSYGAGSFPVVGGGLTVNAWKKKFVKYLTGPATGTVMPVLENSATVARVNATFVPPGAGDTFKIVRPGVTVVVSGKDLQISGTGNDALGARIALIGIKLTPPSYPHTMLIDTGVYLPASHFGGDTITFVHNASVDCALYWASRWYPGLTEFVDDVGLAASYGSGCICGDTAGYVNIADGCTGLFAQMTSYVGFDVAGAASANFSQCNAVNPDGYGFDVYARTGAVNLWCVYIEAKSNNYGVRASACGVTQLSDVYVKSGLAAIRTGPGIGNVVIDGLKGNDATVTNALRVGVGSRIAVQTGTCSLVGAGGAGTAVDWASGAVDSAYPAANNVVTDALGAQVVGYA